jgi:hypothetical protein
MVTSIVKVMPLTSNTKQKGEDIDTCLQYLDFLPSSIFINLSNFASKDEKPTMLQP